MNVSQIQAALNTRGVKPPLSTDGVAGKKTLAAIDVLLVSISGAQNWPDSRRLVAAEQIIYRDAGIEVGSVDGLVGEQTRYARNVYVDRQRGSNAAETWRDLEDQKPIAAGVVHSNKWPTEANVESVFGKPGTNQVTLELPFVMRLAWEPTTQVSRVSCNEKVHGSLGRIWHNTLSHYGLTRVREFRLDMYGGCLNVRKKRGGTSWSIHSFGAAWDVDPDRNQLKWNHDLATLDNPEYEPFWQIVESEGGVSLGRLLDYDHMHFQFCRLK